MYKYAFAILLLFSQLQFSQSNKLFGTVADSVTRQGLFGASVTISTVNNVFVKGMATDSKGKFLFESVLAGKYILKVSNVGYKTFSLRFEMKNVPVDLKVIRLSPNDVKLGEVQVIEKPPLVIINKDTTEFIADAIQTNKDANAEDLVSKMPGVLVQDGKVQAHGEDVKNVLVDGKPFFGDDPTSVLKNIPAEIIERIQVFDKQSEQAEFTGFDDGNTNKTINIITRMNFRNGTFGKFAGGYGDQSKYASGGNINFFNDKQKITLLGQFNNTNEQNFASEDLLGIMSGSGGNRQGGGNVRRPGGGGGGGGGRPPGGMEGGGGGGGRGGGGSDASDFLVTAKNGLTNTKAAGLNYADSWNRRDEINASYFFNNTDNNSYSVLNRDYFTNIAANQKYSEDNRANSQNTNHRFNARLNYQIDTLNSILISPKLTIQKNDGISNIKGGTYFGSSNLNSTDNSYTTNLIAVNASTQLLYRRRFEARGRTISVRLNATYNSSQGDKRLYSENLYFDGLTHSDTVNQNSNLDKKGYGLSTNLSYTEPLTENGMLQFNASYSFATDESDQKTYSYLNSQNNYSVLENSLSNVYDKISKVQNYGISYNYRYNEMMINAGLSYNISKLSNQQTFPLTSNTAKNFYSILPSAMVRYSIDKGQNLMFNYRVNNNEPSVDQLQNVLDNTNSLQLSIGNPNLAQDTRHNLSLRYTLTDSESMSAFFILLNSTFTNNYIGSKTIIADVKAVTYKGIVLNPGTQLRTPENFDGYYNLRTMLTYTFPIGFLSSNMNLNLNGGLTKTPGMINEISNDSKNLQAGLGFVLNSNISKNLDFSISSTVTSNNVTNSSLASLDQTYLNYRSRIKFYALFWEGIVLQTDFEHRYQGGLGTSYDPNSYLWNFSVGKKMFKDDTGELRLTFYDIMNKSNNTTRSSTDYYMEDSRTNVIGSYIMLSFVYNLKTF